MDWLTFISSLVGSLVWPIAVVVVVVAFRKEIRKLIPDLRHIKAGPLAADFGRALAEIEERAEEAEVLPKTETPIAPGQSDPFEIAVKLAQSHPPAAVIEGWKVFEDEVRQCVVRLNAYPEKSVPIRDWLELLKKHRYIGGEFLPIADDLRRLRNDAVHDVEMRLTEDGALEYVSVLRRLTQALREIGTDH